MGPRNFSTAREDIPRTGQKRKLNETYNVRSISPLNIPSGGLQVAVTPAEEFAAFTVQRLNAMRDMLMSESAMHTIDEILDYHKALCLHITPSSSNHTVTFADIVDDTSTFPFGEFMDENVSSRKTSTSVFDEDDSLENEDDDEFDDKAKDVVGPEPHRQHSLFVSDFI